MTFINTGSKTQIVFITLKLILITACGDTNPNHQNNPSNDSPSASVNTSQQSPNDFISTLQSDSKKASHKKKRTKVQDGNENVRMESLKPQKVDPPTVLQEPNLNLNATGSGSIYLVVSVDWEGETLSEKNITTIEKFRKGRPDLPLLQFLNAAYYTKKGADRASITAQIKRTIHNHDETGLHIHGWKSLFEKAGVQFRAGPAFFSNQSRENCQIDCGWDVLISGYTAYELQQVIRFSKSLLSKEGFTDISSFRAGGWVAGENVLTALAGQEFLVDSSAIPAGHFKKNSGIVFDHLRDFWGRVTYTTQPYALATREGELIEFPNNSVLADWITRDEMVQNFFAIVTQYAKNPSKNYFYHIGFHHESAAQYLNRISEALDIIEPYAKRNGIPFVPLKLPLAQHAGFLIHR